MARTEQSVRKGLSETRTIAEDGSQSFARSGNVPLFLEVAGETRPDAGFVQMMGERGPGERVDTLTQSTFQSTMGAKQSYSGRLVERDGQFHFMATEGGAAALGWPDQVGTLAEGKRANLILVDSDSVHVVPSEDPAANVVYAHGAADVLMTMADGHILYEDGHLTTMDEDAVREEARRERSKLFERAGLK